MANVCNLFCTVCGVQRTRENHKKDSGKCISCYRKYQANRIKAKRRLPNSKQLEYDKKWKQEHPDKARHWNKQWKENNRERFRKTNSERQKRYRKKHIEQVRMWKIRYQNKRYREMGTIPLNDPFDGCEGHHINKEQIIYIPKELHKSIWHNHKKSETLVDINRLALKYLFKFQ